MSDIYEYGSLTCKDREILVKELKEDPSHVNSHIESFRRWVMSMPHLECPTDSKFLLMFLRIAKFDHLAAQKRLDNFCTVRASPRGSPQFFKFPSINNSIIEKVLRTHQNIPLGKTTDGQLVLLYRTRDWNPDDISIENILQVVYMSFDIILAKESTQINGIISIFDLDGCNRKTLEIFSDPHLTKSIISIWQDAHPIRLKGTVLYKVPAMFHIILKIMEFFMSEKHRKRILKFDNAERLFNTIPGLNEIMPLEYGGQGGTLSDKVATWIQEVEMFYSEKNPWCSISVDESKRPSNTIHYLKNYEEYKETSLSGIQGSYTKFDDTL